MPFNIINDIIKLIVEVNMKNKLNDFFGIEKRNSTHKTEIFAGITTFLAMAYILVVNPNNMVEQLILGSLVYLLQLP